MQVGHRRGRWFLDCTAYLSLALGSTHTSEKTNRRTRKFSTDGSSERISKGDQGPPRTGERSANICVRTSASNALGRKNSENGVHGTRKCVQPTLHTSTLSSLVRALTSDEFSPKVTQRLAPWLTLQTTRLRQVYSNAHGLSTYLSDITRSRDLWVDKPSPRTMRTLKWKRSTIPTSPHHCSDTCLEVLYLDTIFHHFPSTSTARNEFVRSCQISSSTVGPCFKLAVTL